MASRSGGTPIRTKKVRSGPDQAFTLQKGVSAAPIKGKGMGNLPKSKKATSSAKRFVARKQQLAGTKNKPKLTAGTIKTYGTGVAVGVGATLLGTKKKVTKAKKPTKPKTSSQVEAKAKKARDRKARYDKLRKDPRSTGIKPFSLLKKKRIRPKKKPKKP